MTNTAIYARISSDPTGQALGTKRQVDDCRAEAERRGWTIAGIYVDDDISAYSGKRRPEYERMLDDIRTRSVDAVIVWHMDRLTRRPKELEEFIETCSAAGIADLATVQGDFNLGTGDGMLVARIMAAVAANESASKSRRVSRKMLERAEAGLPGGGRRMFGFLDDKITHHPVEAGLVRDLTERLLAGESLRSLAIWLTEQAVPTIHGGQWRPGTVRTMLMHPRMAGLREHQGKVIGPAVWEPIITAEQSQAIIRLLTDPARLTARGPRKYILAGLVHCGLCGSRLHSHPRPHRTYHCKSGPGFGGCSKIYIHAGHLEDLIVDAVLYRLDSPELQAALTGRAAATHDGLALTEQIASDKALLDDLAAMYGNGDISGAEWKAARAPISQRVESLSAQLTDMADARALHGLIGDGARLRDDWDSLAFGRRRAVISALLDHAIIGPGTNVFTPERVNPIWRL